MLMTQKIRNVILEIERIQLVRKKCQAKIHFCDKCRREADFITLAEAAALFGVGAANLFQFIQANDSHYTNNQPGEIFLCINSFLAIINTKTNGSVKLLEGDKN